MVLLKNTAVHPPVSTLVQMVGHSIQSGEVRSISVIVSCIVSQRGAAVEALELLLLTSHGHALSSVQILGGGGDAVH